MKQIIFLGLLSIVLTGCVSPYKENGYANEKDWQFAQTIQNSTPQRIERLKSYEVKSREDFDKVVSSLKSDRYSDNTNWETIFAYLKDKKDASSSGITVLAQKEKREAEEKAADKDRLSRITKKNKSSTLLMSNKDRNELLIVDSFDVVKGTDANGDTIGFTVQSQYKKPVSFKGKTASYAVTTGYMYCSDGSGRFTSIKAHSGDYSGTPLVYESNIDQKIGSQGDGEFMNKELKDLVCAEARKKGVLVTASDFKSIKEIQVGREFDFKNFSSNLKPEICRNVDSVHKYAILAAVGMQGSAFREMYENGGGGWTGTEMSGDECHVKVRVNGTWKGTSYNKIFSFRVINISKENNGKFYVKLVSGF